MVLIFEKSPWWKSGGSLGIRKAIFFISWISWIRCWPSQVCGKIFLEFWSSHSEAQSLGRQCQLQGKNLVVLQYLQQQVVCCSFFLKFVEAKMVDCLHQYLKCVEDLDPPWTSDTRAKWHLVNLGESWHWLTGCDWLTGLSYAHWLPPHAETLRSTGEWRPGPLVCHLWKCESAFFFWFFFLKVFHIYGPMMDPMYAWRLVKKNHVWSYSPIFLGFPASRLFPPCGFCWRVDRGWFFWGQNRRNFLQKKNKVTVWFLEDWRIDTLNPLVNESFSLKECGGCESLLNLGFHIRHPAKRQFFHVLHTEKYFFYADALANQRHAL